MDKLKYINDTYGHKEGDFAIAKMAEVLHEAFRKSDIIARMGGDEFTSIAIDSSEENAENIKNKLIKKTDEINSAIKKPYMLKFSIGIVEFEHDNPIHFNELLAMADRELYKNKTRRAPL